MTASSPVRLQVGRSHERCSIASRPHSPENLGIDADGCPRLRVPGCLLSTNGEIAPGYLELGYWPIRLIQAELHDFYVRELLEPGWAGELCRVELAYIKSELQRSASLRRKWGFRASAKRLSDARIRVVAVDGVSGNSRGVLASVGRDKQRGTMEEAGAVAGPRSAGGKSALPECQKANKRQTMDLATSAAGRAQASVAGKGFAQRIG
jgi:hypothetical protein